jgi:hypothetical protein
MTAPTATQVTEHDDPRPSVPIQTLEGRATPSPVQSFYLSPSSSPKDLPTLHLNDYTAIPDQLTVVQHPPFNLPALGIVVNLHFRCLICLKCERALDTRNLVEHLRKDLPFVEVPDDLPTVLETTYKLIPYSSAVYNPGPIPAIFGIPLQPEPIFFCECGKGYTSIEVLRPHQTRVGERECPYRGKKPGFHKGYGQRLTANRSFFEVDPSQWRLASDTLHYPLVFCRSLPPLRDYSKMEIKGAEDEMNTSSFFFSQRWLAHLEGYSPEDISEVTRESSSEAPFGELLRRVGEEFLSLANAEIKNHNTFGILKLMGQTTEYVWSQYFFIKLKGCI